MESIISRQLQEIRSLWILDVLSRLRDDGNGDYLLDKDEANNIRQTIFTDFTELPEKERNVLNAQGERILLSLFSKDVISGYPIQEIK
jgi:hypothetical protein